MSSAGNNNDPFLMNDPFAENNAPAPSAAPVAATATPIVPEASISNNINNTGSTASFVANSLESSENSLKSDLDNSISVNSNIKSLASNANSVKSDLTNTSPTSASVPIIPKPESSTDNSIISSENSLKSDLTNTSPAPALAPVPAPAPTSELEPISSATNNSGNSTINSISPTSSIESSVESNNSSLASSISSTNTSVKSNLTNNAVSTVASVSNFEGVTDPELLEMWDTEADFDERDKLVRELQRRNLFPSAAMTRWEYESGAYPDVKDPEFLQKLLAKREFAESLQTTWKPRAQPFAHFSAMEGHT